jgi:hypothetical protein
MNRLMSRSPSPLRPLLMSLVLTAVGACATAPANNYRRALSSQELCCNHIGDTAARNACLTDVPRVQGDELSALNQETFGCTERHFRCDPATGRATRESAQLQLDCLNDLESTQQAPPP